MNTHYQQPIMAFSLSLLVLGAALLLLWFGQFAQQIVQDEVVVREVALVALPPPPPPPQVQTAVVETPLNVPIAGAGAVMPMANIPDVANLTVTPPDAPTLNMVTPDLSSSSLSLLTFDLAGLDELPRLLTPLIANLPRSLAKKLSAKFIVKLDVQINQQGQVSLLRVVSNAYPELKPEIDRIVKTSRFSAPKKDQKVVQARFVWPIEFTP